MKLQIRRGLEADLPTLAAGEFGFCTDTKELYIGDGTINHIIGAGITKLSELEIDAHKDWAGKAINNPGNVDGVDISAHVASASAHHPDDQIDTKGSYVWTAGDDPRSFPLGVSCSFVRAEDGWPSYGTVLNVRGLPGQDGSVLQLYSPYNEAFGGKYLRYRTGLYNDAGWTAWKTLVDISGITFNLGLATVGTKLAQALIPGTFTISTVILWGDNAPTGADLIVDINKNGTTIFTTQANRPKISAGSNSGESGTPNITSINKGDRLSVDTDQVGSTIPGGDDLLVTIIC